jgi:hypothetical protein
MTKDAQTAGGADELPADVRGSILRTAAEVLGSLEPAEVPVALRQVHRFAPRRRATAGALPLWTTLTLDDGFRGRVARVWSKARPGLADSIVGAHDDSADGEAAVDLAAGSPAEVAVGAWLLRPEGWEGLLAAASRTLAGGDVLRTLDAAQERADRAEADAAQLAARLGVALVEADEARGDAATLRREQRRLRSDADRARSEARRALSEAQADRVEAERLRAEASEVLARVQDLQRAADAERLVVRGESRMARGLAETRARGRRSAWGRPISSHPRATRDRCRGGRPGGGPRPTRRSSTTSSRSRTRTSSSTGTTCRRAPTGSCRSPTSANASSVRSRTSPDAPVSRSPAASTVRKDRAGRAGTRGGSGCCSPSGRSPTTSSDGSCARNRPVGS